MKNEMLKIVEVGISKFEIRNEKYEVSMIQDKDEQLLT